MRVSEGIAFGKKIPQEYITILHVFQTDQSYPKKKKSGCKSYMSRDKKEQSTANSFI